MNLDIRWKQRFRNFEAAFQNFHEAIELSGARELTDLEKQGLIQAFEFTHELAWNVLKDYFEYQGTQGIMGSRDATREAFQRGLIANGASWMEMIRSRNQTSRTYNKSVALDIVEKILNSYYPSLREFLEKMRSLSHQQ